MSLLHCGADVMFKILDGEINHADHVKQNWLYTKQPRATNGTSFNDKDKIIVGSCLGIQITLVVCYRCFDQRIYLINGHNVCICLKKNDG